MSVYKKRNSPYWQYDFQFKGVRYFGSTGLPVKESKSEAESVEYAERTRVAKEHAFGMPAKREEMTIRQAFGRYYLEVSAHRKAPKSDLNRLVVIAEILGPSLQFHKIDDNKVAMLVQKLRLRKGTDGELIADSTVNRYTECLRRAWRRAAKTWKIQCDEEPSWGKHLLEEPDERVRDLTPIEEGKLFLNLRADYHPMVKFALLSGLRLSNIRLLTWRHVDFLAETATVRLKSKKPEGRVHTIPLTRQMISLLTEQKGNHPIYVFTYQCVRPRTSKKDGLILVRRKNERYPFTQGGWRKPWVSALKAAGIEDYRFHDNRHTAATRTLRASGNLKAVQKMLGHTDIATTARYAHALVEDVRNAMEIAQARTIPEQAPEEANNHQQKQGGK